MTVSKNKVYCFHHNIIKYQYREFYLYIRYQQLLLLSFFATIVTRRKYKLKDGLDASVSVVKQHGDDVLQDAKYLYEQEKKEEQLDSLTGE